MISHGLRDYLVSIEQLVESTGDSGYPIETFAPLPPATWMSRVQASSARSGGEIFFADRVVEKAVTTWVMPYRADMDPDLVDVPKARRLVLSGRVHDIVEAAPVGRRSQIRLLTRAQEPTVLTSAKEAPAE